MRRDFVEHVRLYTIRYSVGASATRGQRAPGLVQVARRRLATVPLGDFAVRSQVGFLRALDRHTDALRRALPRGAPRWGIARKLLNIYLRNALYTAYLRDAYRLARAEAWYEIPLDSIVAAQLRAGLAGLPRWPGVKHLTPAVSKEYQLAARVAAARWGVPPVHLDAMWWGGAR